jgi:hypothetical protein
MRNALIVLVCLASAVLTGCQKKTSVTGAVTYNAKPIENGYISFSPKSSGITIASEVKDGKYSISEVVPGSYTAIIVGTKKLNHYSSSAEAYANAAKSGGHVAEAADYIAPDASGNNKQVDINPGAQTLDFAVTGPPPK